MHKMGAIARRLGGYAGRKVGKYAGTYIGTQIGKAVGAKKFGGKIGGQIGKKAGGKAGAYAAEQIPIIGSMKKGGPIRRTGGYLLHKGEYVLNSKRARRMRR